MSDFNSLLPGNSSSAERALARANSEQSTAIPIKTRDTKNPALCDEHLLPWLAWEYGVDFWDPTWSESQKRQTVKDAAYINKHRGTAGAVRRSLSAVGYPTRVVEWYEETPRPVPYSFRVEIYSTDVITDELYHQIRRQVNRAKNLRSFMTEISVITNAGSDGRWYIGGAMTINIDIDIMTEGG